MSGTKVYAAVIEEGLALYKMVAGDKIPGELTLDQRRELDCFLECFSGVEEVKFMLAAANGEVGTRRYFQLPGSSEHMVIRTSSAGDYLSKVDNRLKALESNPPRGGFFISIYNKHLEKTSYNSHNFLYRLK